MPSILIITKRILRDGKKGFRRNISLSIASMITISLSIFIFLTLIVVNSLLQTTLADLKQKIDVSIYFKTGTPEEKILSFKNDLSKQSEVKEIIYVSRDKAAEKFKENNKNKPILLQSLDEIGSNPFEASLNIKTKTGDPQEYQKIVDLTKKSSLSNDIDLINYQENKKIINRVYHLSQTVRHFGLVASIILFLLAIVITFNTIRLTIFNRQKEVNIMRLVGAQNWYIYGPFIVEGTILGVFSAIIASIIFCPLVWFLSPSVANFIPGSDLRAYLSHNFLFLFSLEILLGTVLGIFSALITVRKYLRK